MSSMNMKMIGAKKPVQHFNPNTFRIFDATVSQTSNRKIHKVERCPAAVAKSKASSLHLTSEKTRNSPHAPSTKHLTDNCRYLGDPINVMGGTRASSGGDWWPTGGIQQVERKNANYFPHTTQRSSFSAAPSSGSNIARGRHASNPHVKPANGILPSNEPRVASFDPKKLKERISYQHNYNSRGNEPIRGRRHGAFVWEQITHDSNGSEVIHNPWNDRDVYRKPTH